MTGAQFSVFIYFFTEAKMAVTNTFKLSNFVLNQSIVGFEDSSEFLTLANNDYEGMMKQVNGMPTGGVINVRVYDYPEIDTGRTSTTSPVKQMYETITVDETKRLNKSFEYTSLEIEVDRNQVTDLTPTQTAQAMAQKADIQVIQELKFGTPMYLGTSGSGDLNFDKLDDLSSVMDELGIVPQRTFVCNSKDYRTLTKSIHNANLFDQPLNSSVNKEIFVGRYGRFDIVKSNVLIGQRHTAGTAGGDAGMSLTSPVASTDYTSGTITIGGVTTGRTLKKGDRITVTGKKLINPISKTLTTQDLQFVVQADVSESGGSFTDVSVKPGMVPVTAANNGWFANLASLPANGAAITIEGDHDLNFAITKPGLTFATIMLPDLSTIRDPFGAGSQVQKYQSKRSDGAGKLAMRLGFDSQILDDIAVWRLDVQPVFHSFLRYNFAFITAV